MNGALTFWDHVTLLGALAIVVGYIIFRIREALNPSKRGCGGCGGGEKCCPPLNARQSHCPPPEEGADLINR